MVQVVAEIDCVAAWGACEVDLPLGDLNSTVRFELEDLEPNNPAGLGGGKGRLEPAWWVAGGIAPGNDLAVAAALACHVGHRVGHGDHPLVAVVALFQHHCRAVHGHGVGEFKLDEDLDAGVDGFEPDVRIAVEDVVDGPEFEARVCDNRVAREAAVEVEVRDRSRRFVDEGREVPGDGVGAGG